MASIVSLNQRGFSLRLPLPESNLTGNFEVQDADPKLPSIPFLQTSEASSSAQMTAQNVAEIEMDMESQVWTEEELDDLLRLEPMTGAEIVANGLLGGWEHKGITDPIAWVDERRRKRSERNTW